MKLNESFQGDLANVLNGAWENPAEKKLVKIIFQNKDKILANPESGKAFISQLAEKNKGLLQANCSDEFLSALYLVTGEANESAMQEKKVIKKAGQVITQLNEGTTLEDLMRDEIIDYIRISIGEDLEALFSLIMNYDAEGESVDEMREEMETYLCDGGVDDGELRQIYKIICKNDSLFGNYKKYLHENRASVAQQQNKNKMYRYYKVQFLNEAKYVAVPPFAVNTLLEHESVMEFALESKQIKTDKGVDYVIEVSEQEFKEVDSKLGEDFGSESKEEKPQDASIDASKNKFDTVSKGEGKGGAKQDEGKKLHEALLSIFEGATPSKKKINEEQEDVFLGDRLHRDSASDWPSLQDEYDHEDEINGTTDEEIKSQLNGCEVNSLEYEGIVGVQNGRAFRDGEDITSSIDWKTLWDEYIEGEGLYEGVDPDENKWPTGGYGDGEFRNESTSSDHATGREKVYDAHDPMCHSKYTVESSKMGNFEDELNEKIGTDTEEDEEENDIMGDESTKHMTRMDEGRYGSVKCPKCLTKDSYPIAGDYMECPNCHYHWKKLHENNTADINVITDQPAFADNRKEIEDLNPYGEATEAEYIEDADVLQEKFVKFVINNCQGSRAFVRGGKFQLQEFLTSKTHGYLALLEKEFKNSLNEAEGNGMQINDVTVNWANQEVSFSYFYPSEENAREMTVPVSEFFDYLEANDPSWEDYGSAQEFWNHILYKQQMQMAYSFLVNAKGVSKTL